MCGIAGFTFDDYDLIKRMCDVLWHRGPDDEGYYVDSNISLGNRRLSIIDLITGKQPIYNEDKSITVVYNGEIYNFVELRDELERLGHHFYTNSDAEVIVHAYEEWGIDAVKKFNGMFAFALWDVDKRRLMLARDPYGMKPLYYTLLDDGTLIFASEIKAILQYDEVKREVDLEAFHYYVNLRFTPLEKTMFKRIKKLLPGQLLILEDKDIIFIKYYDVSLDLKNYTESYLIKKIREIMERSVRRHLISDVPLGIYLSGGIDSSAVVAFASRVASEPIKTFTMGFGEPTDELDDAQFVADYFGTEHRALVVDAELLKDYPKMIWYADMPKRNLYPYYIAKEVGKYVKVVLSGLGGDELFAGYEWKYQFAEDIQKEREKMPADLIMRAKDVASRMLDYVCKYGSLHEIEYIHNLKRMVFLNSNVDLYLSVISLDEVFYDSYLKNIYGYRMRLHNLPAVSEVFKQFFDNEHSFVDQILLADFKVKLADDFLFVDDAMSMANSVEGRYPFLDKELVEFAFTIPYNFKFHRGEGKYIFKKAMEGILPRRVLKKAKQGFGGSVELRFSREIKEVASQLLPEGYTVKHGFIDKNYIEKVLSYKVSRSLAKHYTLIWNLLAFEIWYRIFIISDNIRKPKLNINSLISL